MQPHRNIITLLTAVLLLTISACSNATPTEPPTSTPEPIPPTATLEPTPTYIPATQDVVQIGAFELHIVRKATDSTLAGFTPSGMGNDRVLYIEFEVLSGDENAFSQLAPSLILDSGDERSPIAALVGQSLNTRTDMTYSGESGSYHRTEGATVLIYLFPSSYSGQIVLEFDTGEIIDLTPLFE